MLGAGRTVKLSAGIEELEKWADEARQSAKNALYKALFAVSEGTAYQRYGILQDAHNANEHFLLVREDLALKFSYAEDGDFGILYIGPLETAPGLDVALELA